MSYHLTVVHTSTHLLHNSYFAFAGSQRLASSVACFMAFDALYVERGIVHIEVPIMYPV